MAVVSSISPLPSSATALPLPQPSSVHRKNSLSRLTAPVSYVAGRTSVQTKPSTVESGDGSVKSALSPKAPATTCLASAAACPIATDKRRTVTAMRSLSMRNYTTKSGPLKAMPSSVVSNQSDSVDGVLQFLFDILY